MFSTTLRRLLCGAALSVLSQPVFAQTSDPALQDVIVVTRSRMNISDKIDILPDTAPLQGGDITYLTARTPGGARVGNGELSGQMQYRGLFGDRLNLRVDGQSFASGGPNLMDPVFHYAPAPLIAKIIVDRGVSPVSEGPGLAGGANAVFKRVNYADDAKAALSYDATLGGRSVNESVSTGGVVGAATDQWRFNLLGAYEEGGDTEFGDGVIGGTAFKRSVYGVSTGVKTPLGEFSLDLRRQNTEPSGNPPFPMDIQYFDTDFLRMGYAHDFGGVRIDANVHATDVEHLMDNFSMRPTPAMMSQRATYAEAITRGGDISLGFDVLGGNLALGMDIDRVKHNVTITNPNNQDFLVTPFPDVEMDRFGGFAEWDGSFGKVGTQLGVRFDNHDYDADTAVVGPALLMGPRNLANLFNAADLSGSDTTFDAVARFWTLSNTGISWRATLARKQRMPGYIQRYGWLPINASGGLADGNIYVGDLNLKPETALIAEGGFDFATERAYLRPTVNVRQIDDYIQGVAYDATIGVADSPVEMIAAMNGDPTPLRWDNVDARLYGVDMDWGYNFEGPLRVDGVLNYVRGKRRDIDDNLYRVAAPNLSLALIYEKQAWSATLEGRAVAQQNKVSRTNSEAPSDSYFVLTAYGDWQIKDGMKISAGIENLLDEVYQDHLSGYNRNGFGDVPLGERIPGAGRGVFIRLTVSG